MSSRPLHPNSPRDSARPRSRCARRALAVAATAWLAASVASAEDLYDGIAAQVGSNIVLVSEVNQMAAPVVERMRKAGAPESEMTAVRADVLDRLIEARLIEDVVRRLDLSASDREVDEAIQGIARDAGLSIEQLQQSVIGHGLTNEEYREKIRSEIERSKVLSTMVRSRVKIEPYEVEALYYERFSDQPAGGEEVHLRHILVAFGGPAQRDPATACAMVESARTEIVSGETEFGAVAREISDSAPSRGGDLGWVHGREMAPWMSNSVNSLEPGQLSGVIETQFGCNLLQLVERRKYEPVTLDQAKPALERMLFAQRMEEEYAEWVDDLREQTYIERKPVFRVGDASPTR